MTVSLRRSSYDVEFTVPDALGGGILKCTLRRGVDGETGRRFRVRRVAVTAEEGQQRRLRETARTYSDWSRGAGFGRASADTEGGYHHGTFLYARSRGILMPTGEVTEYALPSGTGSLDSAFDLAGSTWLTASNTRLVRVVNNGTSLSVTDAAVDFGAGATTGSGMIFGSVAWVACAGGRRISSFDGTTVTPATDDVRRGSFAVADWVYGAQLAPSSASIGQRQRTLIANDPSVPGVYHAVTAPGLTASWSGPNIVGDSAYPIQRLHAAGEAVFAGKPDGIYLIEGGGRMRNLAPHWKTQYDPSNGAYLYFYDEFLFGGHTQFLDMLSPNPDRLGLQMACHPGAYESLEDGPIYGWPNAMASESGYLLAAFFSEGRSHVMAGKRSDRLGLGGRNPMTWYGSEFDCDGRITLLHILPSASGGPRWLLIGVSGNDGLPRLYAQSLPKEATPYMAWKRGGSHRFAPVFTCTQSRDDLGDASSPKNMRYVAVVTENAETTRSLIVQTATDGGSPVTQVTISEAGRQFSVVDEATAAGVNVEATLTGHSEPMQPLVVRSVKLRGTINEERTVVYEIPLEIGRDVVTNRGTTDPSSPWVKRAQLMALLEAGPITLRDWSGFLKTAVVEDVVEDEVVDDDGLGVTVYATATVSILISTAVYGSAIYGFSRYS